MCEIRRSTILKMITRHYNSFYPIKAKQFLVQTHNHLDTIILFSYEFSYHYEFSYKFQYLSKQLDQLCTVHSYYLIYYTVPVYCT